MTDKQEPDEPLLSIRMYLLIKAMERGANFPTAWKAVTHTVAEVPNLDPNLRYYQQWDALYAREQQRNARSAAK